MSQTTKFMSPYEVDIPGTEGWREMYSYYLLFNKDDPKRVEHEASRFWFRDNIHLAEPLYPLDANLACDMNFSGIAAIANRALVAPDFKAYDPRVVNGYAYVNSVEPEGADEIGRRAEIFGPRIQYMYENWDNFYAQWTQECDGLIDEMKQLEFIDLIEAEPESIMPKMATHYPGHNMYADYLKLWNIMVRMSQQTKKALLPAYIADLVFMESVKKLFPGIADKTITELVQGFDTKLFRAVEELQALARLAFDLGVSEPILKATRWNEIPETLQRTDAGRTWLARFEAARQPWFEMSTGEGWQKDCVAWNDNLDYPLEKLKDYMKSLAAGESIDRPKDDVIRRRDKITDEYRTFIGSGQDVESFDRLLGLTRKVAPASEDHSIYQGSWFHNLYCRKLRQIGKLLVNNAILQDPEDVFLFTRSDLDSVVWEMYTSWCRGTEPTARYYWPAKLKQRKEIMDKFRSWTAPPALGAVPEAITSATTVVLFGITKDLVDSWLETSSTSSEKTLELKGFSGCAGIVEGTARICRSIAEISTLQPKDILVTASTAPTWAPAFQIISACVTDMGGMFSHTAIVAREYGIPTVVGTGYATVRIKTGDKIRVDGDRGVVTILERAESTPVRMEPTYPC